MSYHPQYFASKKATSYTTEQYCRFRFSLTPEESQITTRG